MTADYRRKDIGEGEQNETREGRKVATRSGFSFDASRFSVLHRQPEHSPFLEMSRARS